MTDDESGTTLITARLELLVLRGTLPDSVAREPPSFTMPQTSEHLTMDGVVRAMAGMPKPLICTIQTGISATLSVDCTPVATRDEVAVYNAEIATADRILRSAGEKGRPTGDARIIMVRRPGETMLVPEDAFVRWSREYATLAIYALSHRPPEEEDEAGASYVVTVHSVGPVDLDSVPPEILRLLPARMLPGKRPNSP
jgi:hypothetical protein